jgi:transcriptional regulator with XRE-family HTH domain/Zn-dependent peptidase ImmA (M78 family)
MGEVAGDVPADFAAVICRDQCYDVAMLLGRSLRAARESAKLTTSHLAALAGVPPAELERFEDGALSLNAEGVDRCARALGFRMDDLEDWTGTEAPLPLLLRGSLGPDVEIAEMLATEVHLGLGQFQRTVRNIASLNELLSSSVTDFPPISGETRTTRGARGEELAERVRGYLELGVKPIPSMRRIVEEQFGIAIVWVTEDHLDPSVDGASTSSPCRAMLVNLLEVNRFPWRARATMAHELCHLLFDHAQRATLYSPKSRATTRHSLPPAFDDIETVARAFSASLLAPRAGVLHVVGSADPSSEQAIRLVGETYGVGRNLAIARLVRVFRLSPERRNVMELRAPEHYLADFSGDNIETVDGFHGEPLRNLVRRALADKKIPASRARRILGLASTDALPFPELGPVALPTVARAEVIRRGAQALLRTKYPGSGFEALDVRESDGGFRVAVYDGGVGCAAPRLRGHIHVSTAGEVGDLDLDPRGTQE